MKLVIFRRLAIAMLAAQLLIPSLSLADVSALSFTGGGVWTWSEATIGWEFTLSEPVTVTALGVWDYNGNGLSDDHQVGIWRSTGGSPLVSTTVTTSDLLIDGFRYSTIEPFQLEPGTYVVGSYMPTHNDLGAADASYNTQSPVTYTRNLYLYSFGFTIPTTVWVGYDGGNFGANFRFRTTSLQSIPAMNQWGMAVLALLIAGSSVWVMKRREKTL